MSSDKDVYRAGVKKYYHGSLDFKMLGVLDELIGLLMEGNESVDVVSKILDVALVTMSKIRGENVVTYEEDPQLVKLYVLFRKLVRKGIFDIRALSYFIWVSRELKRA